ncbi:hypothetical protein C1T30_41165 [Bacillus sp. MBGLi97]|nr:hypothetical protein C1T30_41165 [Bacillus sp. MBGLi97]
MLIEFKVENFLSIKNEETFTMQTAPYLKKFKESNTFLTKPVNILKSSLVFGPNGSGKTNLFNALLYMKNLILDNFESPKKTLKSLPYQPFLMDNEFLEKPTKFQITLLIDEEIFRYTFHYNKERILFESLDLLKSGKDVNYFNRKFNPQDNVYIYDFLDGVKDFQDITRGNVLYLSLLSTKNDFIASKILEWFENKLVYIGSDIGNVSSYKKIVDRLENPEIKENVINFLRMADFNIQDIEVRTKTITIPDDWKEIHALLDKIKDKFDTESTSEDVIRDIYTIYDTAQGLTAPVHVDSFESRGTKKMLLIATILFNALNNEGQTILMDEFDNAFHLAISLFLLKAMNSKDFNHNSQFILNTHELALLKNNILRVDQIWFAEKNKENVTEFYSLYDFNDSQNRSRNDVSYATDYMNGKYGAWPIVNEGVFKKLYEEEWK